MNLLRYRWLCYIVAVLLPACCFLALWLLSLHAPDDAVSEVCIAAPDWYLAEHRVGSQAYYTLRSVRNDTPWDARYGHRPGSWLYVRQDGDFLFLQRLDGTVLRIHLRTGDYGEVPPPSEPFAPLSSFFPGE